MSRLRRNSPTAAYHPGTVQKLSIVMPVYNEEATVAEVLDEVLRAPLPADIELELIVVESNSSDDTGKIVAKYERSDPRVRLIVQDAPRGKGNAVREGLRHVTGDVVLIQDGDLEYQVADYPRLLAPIVEGQADFVLGSRHAKGRPMRHFEDARLTSSVMNIAHWVFATMFNLVYRTRMRDPFTMYKVFRSECIEGLELVCDRFDFDWELVAKLARRGYQPLEIPVAYISRGYASGKKVRLVRDPLTWLAALVRFRFTAVPPRISERRPTAAAG